MTMTRATFCALILATATALSGCAAPRPDGATGRARGKEPSVRVLVLSTGGSATVATTGAFTVRSEGSTLLLSDRGGTVTVVRDGRTLRVRLDASGESASSRSDVTVEPAGSSVSVGGMWYAGSVRARVNDGDGIDLINIVGLESYLEGVVPHEIGEPGADAYAAVEAQAVAARTYALSRIRMNRERAYDLEAGVADQVYRGRERESRLAASATRDTRGLVLQYEGRLCDTYYSATCGGHTSDIRRVWPDRPGAPYLYGVLDRAGDTDDSFCSGARNFRWRYSFSGRELGDVIRRTLPATVGNEAARVGDLVDLRIAERSRSGRVHTLEIVTSTGTYTVQDDAIRRVIMLDVARGRIFPSTLFDVETVMVGGRVGRASFAGGGNGHGVGMCQNGAIGMARRGYTYSMILDHYYPGTELKAAY
jgi:stage II sporulation protein D